MHVGIQGGDFAIQESLHARQFAFQEKQQLPGGAWVSSTRSTKLKDIRVTDIKGGMQLSDFGRMEDPFAAIAAWLPQ